MSFVKYEFDNKEKYEVETEGKGKGYGGSSVGTDKGVPRGLGNLE